MNQIVNEISINKGATVVLSLENLIREHMRNAKKLKEQVSEQTEMLNNVLENDPTFMQHADEAKKAAKVKTATKSEILKRPEVMQVTNKIKSAREELKEQKQTISELLGEYSRTTGLDSFEMENGKILKIIAQYKFIQGNLF